MAKRFSTAPHSGRHPSGGLDIRRPDDPFERSLAMLCAVVLSMIVTLNLLSDLIETDKIGSLYFIILGLLIRLQVKVNEQNKQAVLL